ncbi:M23 family metallopeptidase [Martelella mediterranea]|uniref:Glycyl-glycine endopeptidase ALE-1 n=1 Tax=Martelella mediterranea DSM 17316 TaxID=1122214 RepID=A0A1U9Z1Y5_9HYPH|nr:M23 family metallopeptidase [Martelella mediterranea]AQZ51705.1 Glycyl-glycine endopeptidase ALE-1 precursor [Martelella mediterranea DSM 17316]
MKTFSLVMLAGLVALSACTPALSPQNETAAIDHFVSPLEGKSEADGAAGPDDRLRLSYAADKPAQTLTAASKALDMVLQLGSNKISVYRYRDPESGKAVYFDGDGNRLGQYLLRNPVPDGRATSGFGPRYHPVLGYSRMHSGADWAAPVGTPIYAAADGTVTFAGSHGGDGKRIEIDHGHGYETSYSHQSKFAAGVKVGSHVEQGQLIGYVGKTGLVTGAHLHYEVSINGRKVDPRKVHFIREGRLEGTALAKFKDYVNGDEDA